MTSLDGNDLTLYFAPTVPLFDPLDLEKMVRIMFQGVPEVSSMVSTHGSGGMVIMRCVERNDCDPRASSKNTYLQGFLNITEARNAFS